MKNTLKDLGLSSKEIDIYLTLLPIGKASASVIAYRTGISRSTAKYICNQLVQKRLFSEGYEGVKNSYRDMVNECNTDNMIAIFSVVEEIGVELQDFFVNEYVPERVKKNIHMKNLCLESPKAIKYKANDEADLRETKFVSKEYFPTINTEINIYGDAMHYMSFDNQNSFAMIVHDKYISSMLKAVFNLLWQKIN